VGVRAVGAGGRIRLAHAQPGPNPVSMATADYRVSLEAFEGPLDLLLYLIRREEVDVHDIPISRITEQYMAHLQADGGIDHIDVDLAAEFLVMAATLMEIKSRLLMPETARAAGEAGAGAELPAAVDPRAELVQQLLAYKRFRDAAQTLEIRHEQWESRFPSAAALAADAPAEQAEEEAVDIEDVDILDLCRAFATIMEAVDFNRLGEHTVKDDETPIQLHAADIMDRLHRELGDTWRTAPETGIEFASVFKGRPRGEAIGLFLAMLELIRQRQIVVRQDRINDRIIIRPRPEDERGLPTETGAEPAADRADGAGAQPTA
jgi:segregation and condensation protein A